MRGLVVATERSDVTLDTPRDPLVVHVARVLALVDAFTGSSAGLRGLSKLARLDFLLLFPVYLEAVLLERGRQLPFAMSATYDERRASEGAYARWKYGPWDHRYYPLLGRLVGQGLVKADRMSGELVLRSTPAGRAAVLELAGEEWELVRGRTRALKQGANLRADKLAALITPLIIAGAAG
jgi:hypothetical protein